jgi:hypothetical protein
MSYNWMPLLGEFEITRQEIRFLGKTIQFEGQAVPAVGNLISDQRFAGGTIEATIQFDEIKDRSGAELVLYYDPQTQKFLLAGLGGVPGAMFDIRGFRPTQTQVEPAWTTFGASGARENLKAGRPYKVRAVISGSVITLHVDEVHVLTAVLPFSLQESQVGVWCLADHLVRIRDFQVTPAKPRAFIVMQFSSPFDEIYSDVIKKACEDNGIEPVRADEIYGPGLIVADVAQEILRSKLIIADITPRNANVFFEVGYALALNKPTILLAEKTTELPFDLSAFRVLFYENSIGGKAKIEEGLRRHIRAIMGMP